MINISGIIGNESSQYSLVKLIQDIKAQPETEPVHIIINSPGGDGELAFNMYDYLRGLGRTITTECTGQCASAASIIFLAGDRRIAGCPIMIHNPWTEVQGDSEQLNQASKWMADFEKRCEKFYSEKTGMDETTISNLMKNETYLSPSEAVALNFATEARQTAMALLNINFNNNKNSSKMTEKKNGETKLQKILAILMGEDESEKKMLDLTTAAGETVSVQRDSGDPQVGDSASPDGSFVMPDGSTIVILNGAITDITPAPAQPANNELELLKAENAKLKQDLQAANANSKTAEEANQLMAVKMAGGSAWLAKQVSSYTPQVRAEKQAPAEIQGRFQDKLEKVREKKLQMYKKA